MKNLEEKVEKLETELKKPLTCKEKLWLSAHTCAYCKTVFTGRAKIFCSKKCAYKNKLLSYKMDLKDGHRHDPIHSERDYGIPIVSIPTNILQEAKTYTDLHNPMIVEDTEKIMIRVHKELTKAKKRGVTYHRFKLNVPKNNIEYTCMNCEETFTGRKRKYCTDSCRVEFYEKQRKAEVEERLRLKLQWQTWSTAPKDITDLYQLWKNTPVK